MDIAKFDEITALLGKHDVLHNEEGPDTHRDTRALQKALAEYFATKEAVQAIVGIDIYRYSHMSPESQRLVPALFKVLYNVATGMCLDGEPFIFQEVKDSLKQRFISTGD